MSTEIPVGTTTESTTTATYVCTLADLVTERGVPVLVHGRQIALFLLGDGRVLAVQQKDPFSNANVLSRGIVGSHGEEPTLSSPMYKQVWNLETGVCLDPVGKAPVDLITYAVHVEGDRVGVVVP